MQLLIVSGECWHLPKLALLESTEWMMRASFLARALLEAEMDSDANRLSMVSWDGCEGANSGNDIGWIVGMYRGALSIEGLDMLGLLGWRGIACVLSRLNCTTGWDACGWYCEVIGMLGSNGNSCGLTFDPA
jgi:hypothetical protein